MALVMTIRGFSQAAGAPAPIPTTYSKGQLLTEQRVMQAYITDANFHIDRGIKAVGASLPDSAKVSLLRATSRVAQVDETMKAHPERIEHLAFSLLYTREGMRKELRASYAKLRDEFGAVEDAMYALRRDMLRKGFFGEALKGQVAVLDAVSKLLPEIQQNDQALAGRIRGVVEEINKALAADDLAKAEELITQLRDMLEAAGHKQDIQKAKDKINETATGGGEGMSPTATQALEGGGSLTPAAGGVTVTGKDGQISTIPGAVSIGAGKLRLADGTEVDLNGSKVQPDGSILLADGRVIKGTKVTAAAGMAGPVTPPKGSMLVDAEGNEILDEYVWENGEGKGVDKIYVGGKGMRLTRETKVTVRATLNAGKANTYAVAKTPGESRTWALVIAPVAGSEKKATGHLTLALALSDRNGGTGFTVNKWDISSPAGAPSMGEGSGPQVTATFDASATYAIQVTGTTDWGSPFVIKASLPVGVE